MISPIKYLTIEDMTKLGATKRSDLIGKIETGAAYPVTRRAMINDETVSVVVGLNQRGDQAEFRMSVSMFNGLNEIPTHESVAELPRKDVR